MQKGAYIHSKKKHFPVCYKQSMRPDYRNQSLHELVTKIGTLAESVLLTVLSLRQKYSRYLPIYDILYGKNARKSSVSKDTGARSARDKDRNARASVESLGKRRSTMNSRAAYDEDEVLRKVLEQSKHEGGAAQSESGTRKKRSRDDSEEYVFLTAREAHMD